MGFGERAKALGHLCVRPGVAVIVRVIGRPVAGLVGFIGGMVGIGLLDSALKHARRRSSDPSVTSPTETMPRFLLTEIAPHCAWPARSLAVV